jgi:hypothetical protein
MSLNGVLDGVLDFETDVRRRRSSERHSDVKRIAPAWQLLEVDADRPLGREKKA